MREIWKEVSLGETGTVVTGKTPPTQVKKNFGEGYLFVTPTDLDWNTFRITSAERKVTEMARITMGQYFLPPHSVSYTCIGNTVGKCCINDTYILTNQQINSIILNEDFDYIFVYYALRFNTATIRGLAGGVATPIINKSSFQKIKIKAPIISIQRKIADILSAYDDLINNNLQRIKLLEEQAQLLYEEWFVRFRFPDHEATPINPETGLPEGWKTVKISDVCIVSGGGTPSKNNPKYWEEGSITWFTPTDLSKSKTLCQLSSAHSITQEGLTGSAAKLLGPDSFMMTSRATIGLFAVYNGMFSTNQGFINITPKDSRCKEYLLYCFKNSVPLFYNYASGTTFLEIPKSSFKQIVISLPPEEIYNQYSEIIKSNIDFMFVLHKQNRLLQEARDLLLPRLMSGEIDVERNDSAQP